MGNIWFPLSNSRRFLDGSYNLHLYTGEHIRPEAGATGLAVSFLREVPAPTGLNGSNFGPLLSPTGLTEVFNQMPSTGEYWVNYNTGQVVFNEDQIGSDFAVDYWAIGTLIEADDFNAIWRALGLTATGTYLVDDPSDWWDVTGVPTTLVNAVDILAARTFGATGVAPGGAGNFFVVQIESWTPSGDGRTYYTDIAHPFGTIDVMVEGFDISQNQTILFDRIERSDEDTVRVAVADPNIDARILISAGGERGATGVQGFGDTGIQGPTGPSGGLGNLFAVDIDSWTARGDGTYYADVKHDLGTYDIIVQGFNLSTQRMVEFGEIEKLDLDNIRVSVGDPALDIRIVIDASGGVRGHTGLRGPAGVGATYAATIFQNQWNPYAPNLWYRDLNHELGTKDVMVGAYDVFNDQQIEFNDIFHLDVDRVRVIVADPTLNIRVLINAYGGMIGETGTRGVQGATGIPAGLLHQIAVGVPPMDGTYLDGLFQWGSSYNAADALDDVNEFLLLLAPPPAPNLIEVDGNVGVAGKLSFGLTNWIPGYINHPSKDINSLFATSGNEQGIINYSTDATGDLNPQVAAHAYAYPAKSFGAADKGTLSLIVGGSTIHSVDLSVFGSGLTVNANGSGFNLSTAEPVEFEGGDPMYLFKYRTGIYVVKPADLVRGYNTIEVYHTEVGSLTNKLVYIIDHSTTSTIYSSQTLTSLSMSGSKYLSGVEYHTGGTADYSITASNVHRNTYSSSASAVDHTGTRCTVADSALGNVIDESDNESIVNITATANTTRIIVTKNGVAANQSIGVRTLVDRTVQSDTASADLFKYNMLMDNQPANSTEVSFEYMNDETYRVKNNADFTTSINFRPAGTKTWMDSSGSQNTIADAGAAGYNDGLQIINGKLVYPTEDFRNQGDGGSVYLDGLSGNPDYSGGACTGEREYIRYFYNAVTYQNFLLNVTRSSTTFVAASNKGSLSGNNCAMEFCAPSETSNGVSFEWKDAVTAYTVDNAIGCYAASFGSTIPTNWGITIGTKSTANSAGIVAIRITCPSSWTGNIDSVQLTWIS